MALGRLSPAQRPQGICERLRTTVIILPWGETRISGGKPAPKTYRGPPQLCRGGPQLFSTC